MEKVKRKEWKVSEGKLVEKINREKRLMYYFIQFSGLQFQIEIAPLWQLYIEKNQEILKGWIQYNMITSLQRRSPNVPGIVNKLRPPQERKLESFRNTGSSYQIFFQFGIFMRTRF